MVIVVREVGAQAERAVVSKGDESLGVNEQGGRLQCAPAIILKLPLLAPCHLGVVLDHTTLIYPLHFSSLHQPLPGDQRSTSANANHSPRRPATCVMPLTFLPHPTPAFSVHCPTLPTASLAQPPSDIASLLMTAPSLQHP